MNIIHKKIYIVIASLFCLTYIILACYKISSPGVQYDELLFVNAASGKVDNSFVLKEIRGVPILLMTYIGALKSYIYYPIFKLFGVNVWSIRLPAILLTALALIIISKITLKLSNWYISLLVLFFLVIDPSFIYMTRLDVGPNVLELFLKCASILFFYRYFIENKSINNLVLALIILGLGLFNKLNFIWFINAFYAAFILINFKIIKLKLINKEWFKLSSTFYASLAYLLYISYFIFIYYSFNLNNTIKTDYFNPTKIVLHNFIDLFNGSIFYKYIYGNIKSEFFNSYIGYLFTFLLFTGFIANIISNHEFIQRHKKLYLFLWLILIFELIQILLTNNAKAPWHVFALYPFFTILFSYSIYSTILFITNNQTIRFILVSCVIVSVFVHSTFTLSQYFSSLGSPTKNIAWSDKIYDLISYTKTTDKKFASIDWGLHNALIAFNQKKDKYFEISYWLNKKLNEDEKNYVYKTFLSDPNVLYISHAEGKEIFPTYKETFLKMISELNLKVHKVKSFQDNSGAIYEVYSLLPVTSMIKVQ